MSKINPEVLQEAVRDILKYSLVDKKRKFVETIELQIGLKNYDPSKDKRFAGSMALPNECKRNMSICVLGNQIDCDKAAKVGMPFLSVEDMKALKKDKKKVKELAAKYNSFLASESVIRTIPRLLGPGLNKAGKFPTLIRETDDLAAKLQEAKVSEDFFLFFPASHSLCRVVHCQVPAEEGGVPELPHR
jgi:large subunit ribosomal protein L10Ae